ncbi:MAG: ABC transporter substrate-binding protein [Chloroflexi bacterium]|nr:ABC transporter substrate-binding protein [Chloroflexota bacterium]
MTGRLFSIVVAIALALVVLATACTAAPQPQPAKQAEAPKTETKPETKATQPESKPQVSQAPKPAEPKAKEQPPKALSKVKVGIFRSLSDAGLYIAAEKGYFREEGIDIEFVEFDGIAKIIPALAAGQLDVGTGSAGAGVYNAFKRDLPIKIVADKATPAPGRGYQGLIVRKDIWDSGAFKDYKDLKGKTVAVTSIGQGAGSEGMIDRALKKGGLTLRDIDAVSITYTDINAALAGKKIDVALQMEPYLTQALEMGVAVRFKNADDFYPNQQTAVLLYAPHFSQSNIDVAKRFMVGYLRGVRYYNDVLDKKLDKKEMVQILVKNTPVKDPAMYDKMVYPGLNPDGYVNKQSLNDDQDLFISKGYIKEKVPVDLVVDNQFADYAVEKLGKYKK